MTTTICVAPPQPGDVVCVPVAGSVGTLIEIGQFLAGEKFKPYEHTEVYIGQADDAGPYGYTVSAYPDRQGRKPLEGPTGPQGALWSSGLVSLTPKQRTGIIAWTRAHEHVGYSAADYFALAAARLKLELLLPPLRDFIQDSGHLICSQYAALAWLEGGGLNEFSSAWDGLVMPMDWAAMLLNRLAKHDGL